MFDPVFHAPITLNFSLITQLLNVNLAVSTTLIQYSLKREFFTWEKVFWYSGRQEDTI